VSKILGRVLGDASAHQLRHAFASRVYAGSRDLLAVQALLGHASVTTTVRYTALPQGALEHAVLAA
jgi:site-specific recombinase XerD